ncbi:MAG: hypothetical protein H6662_07740 [Ardenticatenaceae bacterium]|nr:hypothetical protein [Anaerolineales bacterium]MCB8921456.1 hypothetical protein [Ardenticatenaceae bacterium]MCB8991573.1 hypothetical protein [Ardenticatenaceae bacterium]
MMHEDKAKREQEKVDRKRPYTPPAIIYSTMITTRAGSPLSVESEPDGVDPMDLFGE